MSTPLASASERLFLADRPREAMNPLGGPGGVRRAQLIMVLLCAYVTLGTAWLLSGLGGPAVIHYVALLSATPAQLTASLMLIAAALATPRGLSRHAWGFVAAGWTLYFVGDEIGVGSWLAGRDPFPGPADFFYLCLYLSLLFASACLVRASAVRVRWLQLLLDATIFVVGFGAFFWYLLIRPAPLAGGTTVLGRFLAQAYAALDCVVLLVLGVVLLASGGIGIRARRAVIYLLVGFATMFLADIVWSLARLAGTYLPGQFQDVLYLATNIPLAAAAYEQLRHVHERPRTRVPGSDALASALPYAAMFAAFLVLVYHTRAKVLGPANVMTIVVFALTLLVMVRQALALRSDALLRERNAARRVEQRYASLIANASDAIMIIDTAGVVRFASPASERLLGTGVAQMLGRRWQELCPRPVSDRLQAVLAELALDSGRAVGPAEMAFERDGQRYVFECVGSNLTQDPDVQGYALNLRDISERKALEEQLRHLAFHDPLTRLANRSLFRDRVQHALALVKRTPRLLAVLFLDLDRFKDVNDTLGHDAGDRLLQVVAQRLLGSVHASDTVARLGGDEFAILVESCNCNAEVEQLARRIIDSLNAPFTLGGKEARVGASVGIAYCGSGIEVEALLSNADMAMYYAKAEGRNRHVTFRARMQEELCERLRLETDFDRALAREEFFLEYQPIVDLGTRALLGVEALVRWRHPEVGVMMPAQFIQVLEDRGHITQLGRWTLQRACQDVCAWRGRIAGGSALRLAVNISGRHVQDGTLVEDVTAALQRSGMEAENLIIELVESTITRASPANLECFRRLKQLGARLAIDDFGVGYSSLSYLHSFPIDILKIDRTFVSEIAKSERGSALARAVLSLADTLGLDTLAEGIEYESQVGILRQLGCVAGQGFLFQRPDTLERIAASNCVARRNELWSVHVTPELLSPTGRFRALSDLPGEVPSGD